MSNQTHTDPVKDARKERREYLQRTATKIGLALTMGSVAVFPMLWANSILSSAFRNRWMINGHFSDWMMVFQVGIYVALAGVGCLVASGSLMRTAIKTPYVLPVAEQIAALPADKILVRCSDQPAATPEELLRAAQVGTVEPSEELLRAESRRA